MSKQYAAQHAQKRYNTNTTVNRNNDEEERAAQRAEQIAQRQAERAAQQAAAAQTEAQRQAQQQAQQRAQRAAEVRNFVNNTHYTRKRDAVDAYQAMANTTAYKANSAGYSLQDYMSDMTRYRSNYDNMGYQQQYDMNLYQSYMNRLKADREGSYKMSDNDRRLTWARAEAIRDRYTSPRGAYTPTKEDDEPADMTGRAWNAYLKMVQENRNKDPLTVERYDERVANAPELTDEQKKLGEDMINTARTYSTALSMTAEDLKNATPMQRQAYDEAQKRVDEYRQALKKTGVSDADIDSMLQNGVTNPTARTVQENYEYNDDRLNQLDRQSRTLLNRIVETNAQADQGPLANNAMYDIYGRTNAYADRNRAIELYKIHTGKSDEEIEKDIQAATELYNYNSMNNLNQTLNEEVRANPVLAGAGVSLLSTALSPVRGMNSMTEVAMRGGRADTNAPVDTNSVGYLGTNFTNMGRGAVAQTIAGDGSSRFRNLASQGYQLGMSVADSGYNMLMAGAIGDAVNVAALPEKAANAVMNMVSLPTFGMDAAATQLQQDQNRGISADKALKRAVAAGVIEMATEVFSMDSFWDIVQKKGPAAARSTLMNWFAQAGIEGSEEFASEILNGVADAMINGDQSEYNDNVRNYIESGYSIDEARHKANQDFAWQAVGSFFGGAISGGIMGGVGVYASHVRNVQSSDQLKTIVEDENFKEIAEGIDTNEDAYEDRDAYNAAMDAKALADKLAKKQAAGKKISDAEKGKLYNMTVDLVVQAADEGGKESVDVPEDDDADVTYGEKDVPEAFRPKQNNMTAEEVSQAMVNATTPSELVEVRNTAKMSTAPGAAAMADNMYKLYSQKMIADEGNSYTDVDLYYAENEVSQKDAWLAGANRVNKSSLNLSTKGEIAYNEGQRHRIRNISSSTADTAALKSFTAETIEQNPKIIDPTTGKELSKSMLQKLDIGTRNILEMAQKQQTTDAANAFIQNYEQGVPVGSYQKAFRAFFDQGASGVRTFEEVLAHNNHMLSTMSENTLRSIYNAGHTQYGALQNKVENNTVVRKGTGKVTDLRSDKSGDLSAMPLYEAYAKKTGVDIEITDDMQDGINGSFEKSVSRITFNTNSKRGHGTFFHEGVGEFASAWNKAGMKEVQDEIIRYAVDTMGTDRFSNAVRRYQSAYNQVEGYKAVRDAMDEYVNDAISGLFETADGMGKFAKWLDDNHPEKKDTILGKIAEWLDKVIGAMQELLSGTKRTEAARLIRTMDIKQAEALRQKVLDAMDVAVENYQNATETSESVDAAEERVTVPNATGETRLSVETYENGGREYLVSWLKKNSGLSEADQKDIVDRMDWANDLAKKYASGEELPSFSAWSRTGLNKGIDGKLLLQTYGNDGRPVQSVVVNNGEYPLNIDFTQVCKKRTTLNAVLNTLIDQYGLNLRTLTQTDINTVNALVKKHGFEIACGLCFVDAKRYRVGDWSASFANGTYSAKTGKKTKRGWNDLVRSMLKPGTTASYFNFATNERTTEGKVLSEIDDSEIRFTELDNIIRKFAKYDENGNLTGIGRSTDGKNPTELVRMAYLLRTDPSMRHFLNQNDLIASDGLDVMRQNADPLYKLVNAHWGAGKPKLPHGFTAYGNEILRSENWGSANNFSPEAAYKVGGVRVQSFSDFVANMFFDYMQMFGDMAARKLPSHAYTKEIDYVRLFGMTGQKINMSLVPKAAEMTEEQTERYRKLANRGNAYVLMDPEFADMAMHAGLAKDENGEWTRYIWEDESFNYDDAMAIQADPRYNKNCGAIAVGVSHDHIMKMLDDDNIPMIIPYHKSGISRNIAILRNVQLYTDYTSQQTTRNANGNVVKKDFDFYGDLAKTNDPIKTADNYKAWCKEKGYTEKFHEFSDHPNYYKLLIDFRVYDYNGSDPSVSRTYQPQGAVTMTFPEAGEFEGIVYNSLKNQQGVEDRMTGELSGEQGSLLADVKGILGLQENGERHHADVEHAQMAENVRRQDYSPEALFAKEPIHVHYAEEYGLQRPAIDATRDDIINLAINNIKKYNESQGDGNYSDRLFNDDIGAFVYIGRDSLRHGLGRDYKRLAHATALIPTYFRSAIVVNEADGARKDAAKSYVLMGYLEDGKVVRLVVNHYNGNFSVKDISEALYAIAAKKEAAARNLASGQGKNLYTTHASFDVSVSDFLMAVKETYPDELSKEVADYYGYERKKSKISGLSFSLDIDSLSNDARYQLEDDDFFALFDGTDHSGEPITGFLDDDLYQGKTQNDFVVEATKILEEGAKSMQGKPVRGVKIKNITKNIVEEYNVLGDRKVIEDNLTKVFAYLQTHEDVSYADMLGIVQDVAQDIINNSTDVVGSREEYQRAVKSLQTRKIALNAEQKQEVANVYGSYGKFRQATFNVNVFSDKGTPLDNIWSELCDEFGGLLDYDTVPQEQPLKLMDALDALQPRYEGNRFGKPGSATNKEAAYDLALRIIGYYYGGKNAVSTKELSQQFRDKVRAEYDEKLKQAREYYKEQAKIDVENARVKYAWAKKEDTAGKNAIEKLAEMRARNKNNAAKAAERQKKVKTTESISKTVKRLYKKLNEPSRDNVQNHIPTAMREPLAEFLSVFDFVTPDVQKFEDGKYKGKWGARIYDHREGNRNIYHTIVGETREDAMHKLDEYIYKQMQEGGGSADKRKWYDKMRSLSELLVSESLSTDEQTTRLKLSNELAKVFQDMLNEHSHDQDVLHISQLSAEELDLVDKTLRMIDHAVRMENELFSIGRKEKLDGLFTRFKQETEERFTRTDKNGRKYLKYYQDENKPKSAAYDMAFNLTNVHMLNPRTFFKTKGEGAGVMYDVLRSGWNTRTGDIQISENYTKDLLEGIKISDWKKQEHVFKSQEGKDVRITVPQLMTLYELQKRAAARNHLPGGFKMVYNVNTVGGQKKVEQNEAVHFSPAQLNEMFKKLTPEQIRVADGLQKFFVEYCSKWNNEVSDRLYGFEMFTDEHYFPMRVDKGTVNTNNADVNVLINGIENMGMTKAIKREAKNTLLIEDIFDVYVQHVVDSANYHGYAAPISDLLKWFNYRQTKSNGEFDNQTGTKHIMKMFYGASSNQYIVKLIQDLNGEAKVDAEGKFSAMMMSHYKKSAVGASVRVAIQQPTAYLRAANVIDMRYLLPALRTNPLKLEKKAKYAMEHNKSAYWKSHGYYDSMMGQSLEQIILNESSLLDKIEEATSILAQKGDDWTWGVLYEAVEREIKGENKGIDVNSDEYRKRVNDRFDDVIDQTQVMDSILHRTQMMRSSNPLVQMEMAFQAEPQKTYNMLFAATTSGDKKKIVRAVITYIATGMLTAAAASLWDAFYDKDEEKEWAEKYLAALEANAKDNLNVLSLFPYVKDVISKMDGYDVERIDTQGIMGLVEYIDKFAKWWENHLTGKKNSQTLYGSLRNIVKAGSQASGIPVYNLLRTFEAVNNSIRQYINPDFGLDLTTYTKSKSQTEKEQRQKEYADLYDAIDEGKDPGTVLGQYIAEGKTVSEIKKAIEAEYKTLYGDADDNDRAAMRDPLLKAYTVLGEESPEDVLNKWAGAAVNYDRLDQTIAVGEGYEDEVQNLLESGKTLQGIKTHLKGMFADDIKYRYDNGMDLNDEEELIVDVLVAAGSSVSDAEATLQAWQTGQSTDDGYTSKYADIYRSIDDGSLNGLSTAITESLKENDAKSVTSSITRHYKDQYLETKDSALYQRLVTAYRQLGLTEEEAKAKIKSWSDEGSGGTKVSGMTALYAAIDSGNDFDKAMKEALSTRESSAVMRGVTSTYRDQYVASRDPVLYQRLIATYMALGKTQEEAEKKIQKWIEEAEGY